MSKETNIREIIEVTELAKNIKHLVAVQMSDSLKDVPNGRQIIQTALDKNIAFLEDGCAEIYMDLFTDEEVVYLHAHHVSDVGRALAAKAKFFLTAMVPLQEEWGEMLVKTATEEMDRLDKEAV